MVTRDLMEVSAWCTIFRHWNGRQMMKWMKQKWERSYSNKLEFFSEDDMATTAMQSSTPAITSANTQAADLAAIPKASTPSRKRSKRRAGSADEHSMDRAERMKAAKNLDAPLKQGNNPTEQSFINFTSEQISHDLENLGFCLGQDTESISASVTAYKPRSGEDE
jgi:hypothetical protein